MKRKKYTGKNALQNGNRILVSYISPKDKISTCKSGDEGIVTDLTSEGNFNLNLDDGRCVSVNKPYNIKLISYQELADPLIGKIIKKKSNNLFGNNTKTAIPTITIETICLNGSKDKYLINRKYICHKDSFIIITEEEKNQMHRIWNDIKNIKPESLPYSSTHIRKETNQEKMMHDKLHFNHALYMMTVKHPNHKFEAYNCLVCKSIHIGKSDNYDKLTVLQTIKIKLTSWFTGILKTKRSEIISIESDSDYNDLKRTAEIIKK